MSNEVYGFADFSENVIDCDELARSVELSSGLGFIVITREELYNFPISCRPNTFSVSFMVSDYPGSRNATYLIDYEDYAPEAVIGLPHEAVKRIELLVVLIESLFVDYRAVRVCIAVTDSSEIYKCKKVNIHRLRKVLLDDFDALSPPCCLYDIRNAE